jgi:hypothetical protein
MPWRAERDQVASPGHPSTPGRLLAATFALPLLAACGGDAPAPNRDGPFAASSAVVLLDGELDEWTEVPPLIEDPSDAETAGIDIRWVRALDDPGWFYFAFDADQEVNAQRMPGALYFLIDADADTGTGGDVYGMPGTDLVVEISRVDDPDDEPRGLGAGLKPVGPEGIGDVISPYALDVVLAPTWSAPRFEWRIRRDGASDGSLPALGNRIRVRLVYVEGRTVRDETEIAEYTFATGPATPGPAEGAAERLAHREGSVRVAQLNVSSRSFTGNPDGFSRLLSTVEPDVLLLDELPRGIDEDQLADFFARPPMAALGSWTFVLGQSGGGQRAAIATRGLPIRPAQRLLDVRHPDGSLDGVRATLPEEAHALLEREEESGVPASGAWISLPGGDVLFVVVDLQSRGFIDSPEDVLRAAQARAVRLRVTEEIRAFTADSGSGAEPAVVIGGDLNMVGSRVPMRLLSTRLYSDETVLSPVDAERIGERTLTTWRDARQPFLPGRLDFLLLPSTKLAVENAFVFATEDLGDDLLGTLGLERELSASIADHLVVVADVRVR